MINIPLLKKLKLNTHGGFAHFITALATVVVISMDLGLSYSESELAFYTHPIVQVIAVFCVAHEMLDDLSIATAILAIWLFIKYFKHFGKHLLKSKEEK